MKALLFLLATCVHAPPSDLEAATRDCRDLCAPWPIERATEDSCACREVPDPGEAPL